MTDRPALVFLHGLTFDRRMWDPVLAELPDDQQAIAFDLPGHGGSPGLERHGLEEVADALHEAIVAAGIERPVVVGHSISAALASIYARRHRAAGVVNVDNPVNVEPFAHFVRSISSQLHDDFEHVWSATFRPSMHIERVPEAARGLLRAGDEVEQELVLGYWADVLVRPPHELAALADSTLNGLRVTATPYLAIYGRSFGKDERRLLLERLPQAEIVVWPVDHHFPQLDDPAAFAARVVAFAEGARP